MKKVLVSLFLSLLALPVLAIQPIPETNITTVDQLIEKIYKIMDVAFTILIVFSVAFIIYAGFTYVTAAGDNDKIGTANKMLIYAAVGVLVAVFAKAIPIVVANILR